MDDLKTRFLEAATRPFSHIAETRLAAQAWLAPRIPLDTPQLEEAIRRWKKADLRKSRSVWRYVFYAGIAVISAAVWISYLGDTMRQASALGYSTGSLPFNPDATRERVMERLSESDRKLFPAEDSNGSSVPATADLWRSEPGNVAYFAEYARALAMENETNPEDYAEIVEKLDPDNSWFTYLAASREAKGTWHENPDGSWTINDPARMERVISLLRHAREQKKCESYGAEMLGSRLEALPQRNLAEFMDSIFLLASCQGTSSMYLANMSSTLCAQSSMRAKAGDKNGFLEISKDTEHYLRGICSSKVETLLGEVIGLGTAIIITKLLTDYADSLELQAESQRWNDLHLRLIEIRAVRPPRKIIFDGSPADLGDHSSILLANSLDVASRAMKSPPSISQADLKPGRLLDHAIISQNLSLVTWIVMALAMAATACYRFRVAAMPRGLAHRAIDLLDWRDWTWIAGVGMLLPIGYVLSLVHFTPLGGRDFGLRATAALLPAAHFLGLWLLWFTLPVQMVNWRLAKRAGGMGFRKASWLGWVMTIVAFAFLPLIGWAAISRSFGEVWKRWMAGIPFEIVESDVSPARFWMAIGLMLLLMTYLLIRILASFLARPERLLPAAATSVILTPVYAWTLLISALAVPAFKARGDYWFHQDRLMIADPSAPGWTAYEAKAAAQARKELREALGEGF